MWDIIVASAAAPILGRLLLRPFSEMLTAGRAVRPNYAGRPIPVSMGLTFVIATITAVSLQVFLRSTLAGASSWWTTTPQVTAALFCLGYFSFLGLIDDLLGSRDTGGFGGHFRVLLRHGRLTTGALKALAGGVGAVALAFGYERNFLHAAVGSLIIALSANLINLLDLRPGRAIKVFTLLFLVAAVVATDRTWSAQLLPLLLAVLAYAPLDLGGEAMMGDAGSNALGAAVGVQVALGSDLFTKLIWLSALILVHLYAERHSISETIERTPWLRRLDQLGRGGESRQAKEG